MTGVYILSNAAGEVIYVGASRTVDRRVREHRREWGDEIASVHVEPIGSWAAALRLEKNLILDLDPAYNQQSFDPLERATTLAEFAAALDVEAVT